MISRMIKHVRQLDERVGSRLPVGLQAKRQVAVNHAHDRLEWSATGRDLDLAAAIAHLPSAQTVNGPAGSRTRMSTMPD